MVIQKIHLHYRFIVHWQFERNLMTNKIAHYRVKNVILSLSKKEPWERGRLSVSINEMKPNNIAKNSFSDLHRPDCPAATHQQATNRKRTINPIPRVDHATKWPSRQQKYNRPGTSATSKVLQYATSNQTSLLLEPKGLVSYPSVDSDFILPLITC